MLPVICITETIINKTPAGQECLYDYTFSGLYNPACFIHLPYVQTWTDECDSVVPLNIHPFIWKSKHCPAVGI